MININIEQPRKVILTQKQYVIDTTTSFDSNQDVDKNPEKADN